MNLIDVAKKYLKLEKADGENFRGVCPFHKDSDPSLFVNKKVYHCFGCGASGNIFQFVARIEKCSNKAALLILKKLGMNITVVKPSASNKWMDKFSKHATTELLRNKDAQGYLKKRGITKKVALEHNLGFMPANTMMDFINESGMPLKRAQKLKLLTRRNKDFFNDCIIFPIYKDGNIVSLYGRQINSRSHLYNCKADIPYNYDNIRFEKVVYATESITDNLSLKIIGIKNCVSYYGTKRFSAEVIKAIQDSGIEEIILIPDRDKNKEGWKSCIDIVDKLYKAGIKVRILVLPKGIGKDGKAPKTVDVNWLLVNNGISPTLNSITQAHRLFPLDFFEKYKIEPVDKHDKPILMIMSKGESKYFFRTHVGKDLEYKIDGGIIRVFIGGDLVHKDIVKLSAYPKRKSFARAVATKLYPPSDDDTAANKMNLQYIADGVEKDLLFLDDNLHRVAEPEEGDEAVVFPEEIEEKAEALLKHPQMLKKINEHIGHMGVVAEVHIRVLTYLIATSRNMPKPLSALLTAQSASGKSKIVGTILEMMPPSQAREITQLTRQALFYLPEDALQNKFVLITEFDGSRDADYSIRVMQSEQKLTIDTVMKNPVTNKLETITKVVLGPMALIQTTTNPMIDPQNASRMMMLSLDDSSKQTKNIHQHQYKEKMTVPADIKESVKEIIQIHHCLQSKLEQVHVVIPYANKIRFPFTQVRSRRDNLHFLDLISTVAFLHQYQRESFMKGDKKVIKATMEDYKYAFKMVGGILDAVSDVPAKSQDLLSEIKDMLEKKAEKAGDAVSIGDMLFTRKDLIRHTKWTNYVITQFMEPLVQMELILREGDQRQGVAIKYKWNAYDTTVGKKIVGLISPEELKEKLK